MDKQEKTTLLYFLKANYSTREIDKKLGYNPKRSKGWKSWDILKNFFLSNDDKGKLFIYKTRQAQKIINKIPEINRPGAIDILIAVNKPTLIKKYEDSFLLAKSDESLVKIMSGETRNLVRDIFLPQKRLTGICQIKGCSETELDTCHYKKDRPTIFIDSASRFKNELGDLFMYDIYKIFEDFLLSHKEKRSVVFLCKSHHRQLERLEKTGTKNLLNSFKRKIEW